MTETRYLLFTDRRFRPLAREEAMSIFPGCRIESYGTQGSVCLITAISEGEPRTPPSEASFIDFAMRVDATLENARRDYGRICAAIREVLEGVPGRSFRLEVRNIESRIEESAKDIEVMLGRDLERQGFLADIKGGEVIVYVVLINDDALVGHARARAGAAGPLDLLRSENAETGKVINRAEFKLMEAVDFFGIDLKGVRTCLDIGAAPGGWTHYLSRNGVRVVARDTALLDYARLSAGKRILVLVEGPDVPAAREQVASLAPGGNVDVADIGGPEAGLGDYDIVHLRATMTQERLMQVLGRFGKFDMLVIDANTSPEDSARIADEFEPLTRPGSPLVMTVKLVSPSFRRHIRAVYDGLEKCYGSVRIKKLIHNRMELTAYAVSKGAPA